jgi:NAD+ synthase (glutamine-hydrolysing)
VILNIAASPFHYDQSKHRREVLSRNAKSYKLPLFYVNHVGAQTELLFDGGSMVVGRDGSVVDELDFFKEDFRVYDLKNPSPSPDFSDRLNHGGGSVRLIHEALVMGIRDYFHKMGFSRAILGLSGGIDSAVTLVLAAEALGKEHVRAVLLPSEFSSEHSITDAVALTKNLGIEHEIISIENSFKSIRHTLEPQFRDLPFDLAEENIQARIRAVILMALSNKFGYILLNTSNKSEAAVGYGTLYGDMAGGLSVLGDVYKTQVYELASFINRENEIIPENTIKKPPSAELRPNQKDADSLPDYEILDKILFQYIELRKGPGELIQMGFDEAMVRHVLKLVNTSEYKRAQCPPILRVSPKAFGMGRRMPIVGKYLG